MTLDKQKKIQLTKLKLNEFVIYGIFDFNANELVYVSVSEEQTEMEYDLGDYDEDRFDMVAFLIVLA